MQGLIRLHGLDGLISVWCQPARQGICQLLGGQLLTVGARHLQGTGRLHGLVSAGSSCCCHRIPCTLIVQKVLDMLPTDLDAACGEVCTNGVSVWATPLQGCQQLWAL
jgi:hypothetical protein